MKRIENAYGVGVAVLDMYSKTDVKHDVDVQHMVEVYLAIAIYVSATSVDHPGWPAAAFSGIFAQWLILSCLITSKGAVFVFGLT